LAAGFRPDLLGEIQRSPDPLSAIGGGVLFLRERKGGGRRGEHGGRKTKERGG